MITLEGSRPLLVLTTSYPSDEGDGAGSFVRGFCRASVAAGLEVEVLCPELACPRPQREEPGIRVLRLPYLRPRRWQFLGASPGAPEALSGSGLLWVPALAFGARLAQVAAVRARRRPFLGIVAHWLLPGAMAGLLGAPGHSLVGIAHGSDVHLLERMPGGALLARQVLARARALCFVSEELRGRFSRLLPWRLRGILEKRSMVQPMGVDPSLVAPDRAAARAVLGLSGPVVLWMGRFVPLKAPERAIHLAEALPGVTFVLAGDGPLAEALAARARALGVRVLLPGFVGGTTKERLLAAADALVLTSRILPGGRSDSLPVVALEALASGLPVVATQVGGLASLGLPAGQLHLVPEGDEPALAGALGQALAGGRLAEPAQLALARRFGWDAALPRILGPLLGSVPRKR